MKVARLTSCDKYNEKSKALEFVFNGFTEHLKKIGVSGNYIACCGKDYKRYEKYTNELLDEYSTAVFIENDPERHNKIKQGIKSNRIKVKLGDIFNYKAHTNVRPIILDQSVGLGLKPTMLNAAVNLYLQSKEKYDVRKLKAHILTCVLRTYTDEEIIYYYKNYVSVIGLEIETVNGEEINNNSLRKDNGEIVYTYNSQKESYSNSICNVRQYEIKFKKNNKEAELYLIKCKNGGHVLHSMLIYRG